MVKQLKRQYGQPIVGKINKFSRLSRIKGKIAIEWECFLFVVFFFVGIGETKGKINSLRVCSSWAIKVGLC